MPNMPNAPLIYTIGMVKFPRNPDIGQSIDKFFSRIRNDYPYDTEIEQKGVSIVMTKEGPQFKAQSKTSWQYLSTQKNWAFILGDDYFCLHTNSYLDSKDFLDKFRVGISEFAQVQEFGIKLITSLGIRYVDLVIPERKEHKLTDYLAEWVLPIESPIQDMTIVQGTYLAKYKTRLGTLNFQAIRNPERLIPPDLDASILEENGWANSMPQDREYVVIDTDHICSLESPMEMDVDWIVRQMDQLHLIPKKVFEAFGTPKAIEYWNRENAKQKKK
jgi:uncharacterized protein (TIGR04255 family)